MGPQWKYNGDGDICRGCTWPICHDRVCGKRKKRCKFREYKTMSKERSGRLFGENAVAEAFN